MLPWGTRILNAQDAGCRFIFIKSITEHAIQPPVLKDTT
jgi:hypothetical protein